MDRNHLPPAGTGTAGLPPRQDPSLLILPRARRQTYVLPGVLIALLGGLLMAARVPMWGSPAVELNVESESLRLVLDGNVDLVGRSRQGDRPGATGVPLASPWIYLRGMDVVVTDSGDAVVQVPDDRALPAVELQQLQVSRDCVVNITTFPDGFVRLAISPATADSTACRVLGAAWPDPAANGPDSLRLAPPLENVPLSARLEIRAAPTPGRPAVLQFHPAEPLQVFGIPVSWLSFETYDRGRYPESSIRDGTVVFPGLRARSIDLDVSDTLSLHQLRGKVAELAIGQAVVTRFAGTASAVQMPSSGSIKPTSLAQVQSSTLLIAVGVIIAILAGLADLMGRRE